MTDQTVNIPLLRKAVEWAEAEAAKPEGESEWYQGFWLSTPIGDCGTAYCIAGWVAQHVDPRYALRSAADGVHACDIAGDALGLPNPEPSWVHMGLTGRHAMQPLFSGGNSIEDVRRIAESIAGERL